MGPDLGLGPSQHRGGLDKSMSISLMGKQYVSFQKSTLKDELSQSIPLPITSH